MIGRLQGKATELSRIYKRRTEPRLLKPAALGLLFQCGVPLMLVLLDVLVRMIYFLCSGRRFPAMLSSAMLQPFHLVLIGAATDPKARGLLCLGSDSVRTSFFLVTI